MGTGRPGDPRDRPVPYEAGRIGDGHTVLVVDDHDATRGALAALLELEGYEVVAFANGGAALEAIPRLGNVPEVAIVDLTPRSMDGFAFLEVLRNDARLRGVRLIALSAHPTLHKHALDTGFDAAIRRPCDVGMLLSLVAHHCRQSERRPTMGSASRPRRA